MSKRCSPSAEPAVQAHTIIGIDVAKDKFVIAQLGSTAVHAIDNNRASIKVWLKSEPRPVALLWNPRGATAAWPAN
jgi:hypothetical protein